MRIEFVLLLSVAFTFWLGIEAGALLKSYAWKTELVTRVLAIYCPLNGHFAFKGECEK